jgi:hypothetical protein
MVGQGSDQAKLLAAKCSYRQRKLVWLWQVLCLQTENNCFPPELTDLFAELA